MVPEKKEERYSEYHYYVLNFDSYVKKLGIPLADVQRTLRVTPSQFQLWRETGRIPVPVWKRASEWWGDQGIQPSEPKRVEVKAFMIPTFYQKKDTNVPIVSPIVAAPSVVPEPAPPSVPLVPLPLLAPQSDSQYLGAIDVLVRFAASVVAEKALLHKEVERLHLLIKLLEQTQETRTDLIAMDGVVGTVAAPPLVVTKAMETLKATVKDASLLKQVEQRLPFVLAR